MSVDDFPEGHWQKRMIEVKEELLSQILKLYSYYRREEEEKKNKNQLWAKLIIDKVQQYPVPDKTYNKKDLNLSALLDLKISEIKSKVISLDEDQFMKFFPDLKDKNITLNDIKSFAEDIAHHIKISILQMDTQKK